jgi:hypothetical protein
LSWHHTIFPLRLQKYNILCNQPRKTPIFTHGSLQTARARFLCCKANMLERRCVQANQEKTNLCLVFAQLFLLSLHHQTEKVYGKEPIKQVCMARNDLSEFCARRS